MISGYIYNPSKMTKEDKFVIVRRITTYDMSSRHQKPIQIEFGNGWIEVIYLGDITKRKGYEEFDEDFKN